MRHGGDISKFEKAAPDEKRYGETDHTPAQELADPVPHLVRDKKRHPRDAANKHETKDAREQGKSRSLMPRGSADHSGYHSYMRQDTETEYEYNRS